MGSRKRQVLVSLLFVDQNELTEFHVELTEFAEKHSEFSSPNSRNSIPPVPYEWPHIARDCDTIAAIPHIARCSFREVSSSPKWCDTPPLVLSSTHCQAHLCDTPFCNISRDNCATPHKKTRTKEFCDTIATGIARYEKYRCWASKLLGQTKKTAAWIRPVL